MGLVRDFMLLGVRRYGRKVHVFYRADDFETVRVSKSDHGSVDRARDYARMVETVMDGMPLGWEGVELP